MTVVVPRAPHNDSVSPTAFALLMTTPSLPIVIASRRRGNPPECSLTFFNGIIASRFALLIMTVREGYPVSLFIMTARCTHFALYNGIKKLSSAA